MDYENMIKSLEQSRKQQIEQNNWHAAKKSTSQLQALKEDQAKYQQKFLKLQRTEDQKILEETYSQDLAAFQDSWNKKFSEFQQTSKTKEQELISSHQAILKKEKARLEQKLSMAPKYNKEYFELKKVLNAAAKTNDFDEAINVQKRIDKIVRENKDDWLEKRHQTVNVKIKHLKKKLDVELSNFKKKQLTLYSELKRLKEKELDTFNKKHNVNRQDLQSIQKKDKTYMQNRTTLFSRLSSSRNLNYNKTLS